MMMIVGNLNNSYIGIHQVNSESHVDETGMQIE